MRRLLLLSTFLISFLALGQEVGNKDIKVGLVLSGGGAKGLAHIGALKVLEEAGIKIDYIGGTSMGAIIGALYASGYSAQELDSLFTSVDFSKLIQDELPRDAKTFYEKEDSERYALTLPFNNLKVSFPEAISGGQNIYNELVKALYHVKDINNFEELPIPFFCIATNVETGKQVMLDKGYLPEAIMASGTFPSLFEPTEIEGQILIDGGVVNNYPIREVKERGANYVIGVDVQHGLSERESLLSATEVLLQINNYRTVNDMVEKSKLTDIYIKPDIDEFSVIDFNLTEQIIQSGQIAAMEKIDQLKEVSIKQINKEEEKKQVVLKDSLTVNRLRLIGNNNYSRGYVKGKLRFDLAQKTTFDKVQKGIGNLAATNNFKTIRYQLKSNGAGDDLVLKLSENHNKTFIRLGVHYDDLFKSAALINLTKKNFLMKDDVTSFDFILGDNLRYNMQYYVDKGSYWSFGLNSKYTSFDQEINYGLIQSNFNVPINTNINNINMDVINLTNQFYIQSVWQEEFAFTAGLEHNFLRFSTRTFDGSQEVSGNSLLVSNANNRTIFDKSHYYSTYGQLTLDTYDDKYFPTKGLYFNGDLHVYLFSSDFNNNFKEFSVGKARMGAAFSFTKNLSLNLETEGGVKFGISRVSSFDFVLGGFGSSMINNFVPFLGYDFLTLPGNSFVKAYGKLDYEFTPKNHFMFAANFSNVDDDLFRTGEWFTPPDFSGYGLGYGLESFIGPVQLMYSWSPEVGSKTIFFSVGYWF
ncbi:NTE family protein [Saonia flava]|uniref:NTE family protein n=1 Tax=Saonia flava TaxID=523696 RepID=A0A846QQD3_9FLAO|nr:patatin-like phospholipase family protein [Saonia flava]NJB71246.1 NTE family protein [Saonia flava]